MCVCSLSYPSRNVHALYYTSSPALPAFPHWVSSPALYSEKYSPQHKMRSQIIELSGCFGFATNNFWYMNFCCILHLSQTPSIRYILKYLHHKATGAHSDYYGHPLTLSMPRMYGAGWAPFLFTLMNGPSKWAPRMAAPSGPPGCFLSNGRTCWN